jgi:transcription elongation factor Elf1
MKDEIDCKYTDNIICPHCGEEFLDSWDIDDDVGELACYACDKMFKFTREVEITYSTSKIEDK